MNFKEKIKFFFGIIFFFNVFFNKVNCKNNIKKVYIFVHGTEMYTFPALFIPSIQEKLTQKRWQDVLLMTTEKKGLVSITKALDPTQYNLKMNNGLWQTMVKYQAKEDTLFYRFNWDGELSNKNRAAASKQLAYAIVKLKNQYPQAIIYLVGYSHGGNVAAQIFDFIPRNSDLIIDYLILLATPIGSKTEKWVNKKRVRGDFRFTNVYNFYSSVDFIQIKDIFFNFPFCKRCIDNKRKNIFNFKVQFFYNNHSPFDSFIYLPNHKDFWFLYENKKIKNNTFYFYPFIYYLVDVVDAFYSKKYNDINIKYIKSKKIYELSVPIGIEWKDN